MIFKCYWRSVWYGVRHVYLESISYLPISIYLRWGEGQHALDLFDTQKECKFVTIFYELVLTNSHMWMLFILRFWCNRPWSQWGIASATEKISDQSLQLSMCRFVSFFKFIYKSLWWEILQLLMAFFIVGLMMGEDCLDHGDWQLMVIYLVYVDTHTYRPIYHRVSLVEGYKREA